jgi:hypothetical protein
MEKFIGMPAARRVRSSVGEPQKSTISKTTCARVQLRSMQMRLRFSVNAAVAEVFETPAQQFATGVLAPKSRHRLQMSLRNAAATGRRSSTNAGHTLPKAGP